MELIKPGLKIDFLGKKVLFLLLSAVCMVSGLAYIVLVQGGLKYGIDFASGAEMQIKFSKPTASAEIRRALAEVNLADSPVQTFGDAENNEFLIKIAWDNEDVEIRVTPKGLEKIGVASAGEKGNPAGDGEAAPEAGGKPADVKIDEKIDEKTAPKPEGEDAKDSPERKAAEKSEKSDSSGEEDEDKADEGKTAAKKDAESSSKPPVQLAVEEALARTGFGFAEAVSPILDGHGVPSETVFHVAALFKKKEARRKIERIKAELEKTFGPGGALAKLIQGNVDEGVRGISQALVNAYGKEKTAEGQKEWAFEIRRSEKVDPFVARELQKKGFNAIYYSLAFIFIYIVFRFKEGGVGFASGAVAALVHDVIFTVSVFSVAGKEFNLPVVAAILTIIGYSLNDTIVVFDRIRENLGRFRRMERTELFNRSINETLSRTLITSITTLFVVACLFVFGGAVIHDFAFALLVGILVGTYSSIYIASPVALAADKAYKVGRERWRMSRARGRK